LKPLTRSDWLETHAYLQPVAELSGDIDRAAASVETARPETPAWEEYEADFRSGVPLLQSLGAAVDLAPAGRMTLSLVHKLASDSSFEKLRADASALDAELQREAGAPRRIVDWLLGETALTPSSPGLLRYLGWTALGRYLAPVRDAFASWRDEERWLRPYCPTCGSAPSMAHLVGVDPGRLRFLSCGRCGTRWRYKRTGCPFCEDDAQRLAGLTVEGERGLRIDYCESCRGYLKTYDGQGDEALLLSDWTSLHLDLLAHDRGLKRLAASLYDLEPLLSQEPMNEAL